MPKPNIRDIQSLPDPLLSDNFALEFPTLPAAFNADLIKKLATNNSGEVATSRGLRFENAEGSTFLQRINADVQAVSLANKTSSVSDVNSALKIRCKSATLPASTIEQVTAELYGYKLHYPGMATFGGTMSVEYVEDNTMFITKVLRAWQDLARKFSTQSGHFKGKSSKSKNVAPHMVGSAGYATNGELSVFKPDGSLSAKFIISTMWPMEVSEFPFDGSAANHLSCTVTFSYDYYSMA